MFAVVDLVAARSYPALVLREKTLSAFNKLKHSKGLARQIQSLREERADRIRIKEKLRAFGKLRLIDELERPHSMEPRFNEQMETFEEVGNLHLKLAGVYLVRNKKCSKIGRLLERYPQRYFLSKAVRNISEAASIAHEGDNLYEEVNYKGMALSMLNTKIPLTPELCHLKEKLDKEVPGLERALDDLRATKAAEPKHGN